MSAGAFLVICLTHSDILRRNNHPQRAPVTSQSRGMCSAPSVDPRLAEQASHQCRSCKERFLIGLKSIIERRQKKKEGKRRSRDLGLDSWDGFAWAEQRQDDGQEEKRVWDHAKKEWVVVPNLGLERSVSPYDMRTGVKEDISTAGNGEDESMNDSFYVARTTIGSPAETSHARISISARSDDTDATIRPSMMAVGYSDEMLRQEQTNDSEATIRPYDTGTEYHAELTRSSVPATDESPKATRLSLQATRKHISLRRAAIWNAARISGRKDWKGLDFWKFGGRRSEEAQSESNEGEEPLLGSSRKKVTNLQANPSKSNLDGLAKLIGTIDSERVNTVRHIWHEETHEWTHERTAGPSSS
jgi:hypothetical protein